MNSQRQVQFQEGKFLPLVKFSLSQSTEQLFQLHDQGVNIIQSITSSISVISVLRVSNNPAFCSLMNQILDCELNSDDLKQLNEFEGIWISNKVRSIQNQQRGMIDMIVIGGNINGDDKDRIKLKFLSEISSLMILNCSDQFKQTQIESLQKDIKIISKIPSVWVSKKSSQNFEGYLKQNSLKELMKIFEKQIMWKQIFEIDEASETIQKAVKQINPKYQFGKPLTGRSLLSLIAYLGSNAETTYQKYIEERKQQYKQFKELGQIIEKFKAHTISTEELHKRYLTISQRISSLDDLVCFHEKMIEQLIELLNRPVSNHGVGELEEQLKVSNIKIKQIQERYQSTKRYVEIVRNQYQDQIKESNARHQLQKSKLNKIIEQYEIKINNQDIKIEFSLKLSQLIANNQKLELQNRNLRQQIQNLKYLNQKAQLLIEQHQIKANENKQKEKQSQNQTLALQFKEYKQKTDLQIKGKDKIIEHLKVRIQQLTKELSIITQKEELNRLELGSIRQKYNEAKLSESKALDLLDTNNNGDLSFIVPVDDQVNNKLNQIKQITKYYEKRIKQMEIEIRTVTQFNNELQLKNSILIQDNNNTVKQLSKELEDIKNKLCEQQAEHSKLLQSDASKIQEIKTQYQLRIQLLQNQLQSVKDNSDMTILQSQDSSEADVMMIKSYYEQERMLKDKKLHDQKAKLQNNFERKIEDIEQRHKEELDELMENRQQTITDLEMQLEQLDHIIQSLQVDQINKTNQISNLNQKISYLNTAHANQLVSIEAEHERVKESLKQHMEVLESKYEQYKQSSIANQTKIIPLQKEVQRKSKQYQQLNKKYSQIIQQFEILKEYSSSLEEQKKKMQGVMNELSCQNKIQIDKRNILSEYYTQYSQNKILELEILLSQTKANFEKQKQQISKNLSSANNSELETLRKQNQSLQNSYEQLISVSKAKQIQLLKKIGECQTQVSLGRQKIINLEYELSESTRQLERLRQYSNIKVTQLKESLSKTESALKSKTQSYELKVKDIETQKMHLSHQLEKNKALQSDKLAHIQSQRKQEREDHQQKINKLTSTIQFLKSKDKSQNKYQAIETMQTQYSEQIKALTQKNLLQQFKFDQTIKLLNIQLKSEKQKVIHLQSNASLSILGTSNRADKSYQQQIQRLRAEKQSAIASHQKSYFTQKQTLRSKIKLLEQKVYELERNKSFGLFEQEKNQAKWNLEKQYLKQNIKQLQEALSSLKHSKQKLEKQNENIKAEKRKYKNLNVSMSMNMKSSMLGSFSKWDESEKFKNINVKDYSIFGSECKTPDAMSNNEDSVISERSDEMVRTDNQ